MKYLLFKSQLSAKYILYYLYKMQVRDSFRTLITHGLINTCLWELFCQLCNFEDQFYFILYRSMFLMYRPITESPIIK